MQTISWVGGAYKGQLQNRVPHGLGQLKMPDGTRYEGEWKDGKPHGKGVLVYAGGLAYKGDFVAGKRHGYGKQRNPDGQVIEGLWENGQFKSNAGGQQSTAKAPTITKQADLISVEDLTFRYGTFTDEEGYWQLVGGGDIYDGDAIFHMVFNLVAVESPGSAGGAEDADDPAVGAAEPSDLPLEQFLVGSWMRDELFGEYMTKTFNANGTTIFTMDKPGGAGDDINNWPGGTWQIVEAASGEWAVVGPLLVADVTPEHLSLETEVKIIDQNTIEIVEMHTKTLYYRIP